MEPSNFNSLDMYAEAALIVPANIPLAIEESIQIVTFGLSTLLSPLEKKPFSIFMK